MRQIYLDNASTSFPKPKAVADAVYKYMTEGGANLGRGRYASAIAAAEAVFDVRCDLCALFGAQDAQNVVFTKNITEALNLIIKGLLHPGDHVLVSSLEHNAVMRPLQQIGEELTDQTPAHAISFSRIPADREGNMQLELLPKLMRPNTRAIICTHASNVCGTLQPLAELGRFCRNYGLWFIVDTAQTAGSIAIDMQKLEIDALAFTGHKGLLGPQGIGGCILNDKIAHCITPLVVGGTGSASHTEQQPDFLPDKFEAGTLNIPGIIGLGAALRWLRQQSIEELHTRELALTQQLLQGLQLLEARQLLRIIGRRDCKERTSVVSISTQRLDIAALAYALSENYGIATRVGLHCAPHAHKVLGTYPTGTLRFSPGWSNSAQDIESALQALEEVLTHGI